MLRVPGTTPSARGLVSAGSRLDMLSFTISSRPVSKPSRRLLPILPKRPDRKP
jgi:hypothetical protein